MASDLPAVVKITEIAKNVNIQTQEISRSKGRIPSQIFWWACLIISVMIFLYQCLMDIMFYYSYPTTTEEFEKYHETISFPDIAFCAPFAIPHNLERAINTSSREEMLHFLSSLSISPPLLDEVNEKEWRKFEEHFRKLKKQLGVKEWDNFLLKVSSQQKDFIKSCTIRGQNYPCNERLSQIPPIMLGTDTCFVILLHHGENQTLAGPRGAFRATISKESFTHKYLPTQSLGWNIWLLDFLDIHRIGNVAPHAIPEGEYVEMKISLRINKRLNRAHSPCEEPSTLSSPELGCQADCESRQTMKHCGCYRGGISLLFDHSIPTDYKACEIGYESFCAYNASRSYTCNCGKLMCESVEHSAEISIRGHLDNPNMTEVAIFHERLREIHKVQFPAATVSSLVGTVGGQASILLGLRAANIIQMLFYTIAWLWYRMFERGRKNEGHGKNSISNLNV